MMVASYCSSSPRLMSSPASVMAFALISIRILLLWRCNLIDYGQIATRLLVLSSVTGDAPELCEAVRRDFAAFRGDREVRDDVALVCLSRDRD
jgi:hypothetical protein